MQHLYIVLLSIFYIINARVYISIFAKSLQKKYNNKLTYAILWLVLSVIVILKQFAKLIFYSNALSVIMSTATLIFLAFIVFFSFVGSIKKKIIVLGTFYTFSVFIDVIAIGLCTIVLHVPISSISELGLGNVIASGMESLATLLILFVYIYILSKHQETTNVFYDYNELFVLSIIALIIVIPSIIVFNNIIVIGNRLSIIVIAQFGIIAMLSLFFGVVLYKKNLKLYESGFKTRELKKELEYYNKISESFEQLRKLRHDMLNHIEVIHMLLKNKEYDKSLTYIESLYDDIKLSRDICTYNETVPDDKLISIVLTEKIINARERGVTIKHSIVTNPFFYEIMGQMKDTEKTALFANLLDNAIEAAEQTPDKEVQFEIRAGGRENSKGETCCIMLIRCKNQLPDKQLKNNGNGNFKTTKKDKSLHGLGMGIIDDIVHKYGGTINKGVNLESKHIKHFAVDFNCEEYYHEPTSQEFETEIYFERGVMDEADEAFFKNGFGIY